MLTAQCRLSSGGESGDRGEVGVLSQWEEEEDRTTTMRRYLEEMNVLITATARRRMDRDSMSLASSISWQEDTATACRCRLEDHKPSFMLGSTVNIPRHVFKWTSIAAKIRANT